MPAVPSAWLIGAITLAQQDFTVDAGGGFLPASLPAGTYYLRHATNARSLIHAFGVAVQAVTGVPASNGILRSRLVYLDLGNAAAVNWGGSTQLRDLLGFTGNLPSAVEHTASEVSALLWSPGYPASPKTIPGVLGYSKPHQAKSKSDDGTLMNTYHFGKETWQDLEWDHVLVSRLRVASGNGGGTFHEFFEQCAMLGAQFFHYEQVTEDSSSSTLATLGTGLGPYVLRGDFDGDWYARRVRRADISSPLTLPLQLVSEYS